MRHFEVKILLDAYTSDLINSQRQLNVYSDAKLHITVGTNWFYHVEVCYKVFWQKLGTAVQTLSMVSSAAFFSVILC